MRKIYTKICIFIYIAYFLHKDYCYPNPIIMNQQKLIEEFEALFQERIKNSIPQLSIDCVIFSYHEEKLRVLLLKIFNHNAFVLPSGFIFQNEDIDNAALRNLKERTGLDQIFLQQFHAFGKASRYYPDQMQEFISSVEIDKNKLEWLFQRFVSIGYYALVNYSKTQPQVDVFTEEFIWADVKDLPNTILDHADMIQKAMESLKKDLQTQPIGLQLLPEEFTLPELHHLYEIILNRKSGIELLA